jgi:hypothetical protein
MQLTITILYFYVINEPDKVWDSNSEAQLGGFTHC